MGQPFTMIVAGVVLLGLAMLLAPLERRWRSNKHRRGLHCERKRLLREKLRNLP